MPLRPGDPGYNQRFLAGGGMGVYKPPPLKPGATWGVAGGAKTPYLTEPPAGRTYNPLPTPDWAAPGGGFPATDTISLADDAGLVNSGGAGGPAGGWINVNRSAPDYRGILNQYTTDWKARLNAGLASNEAQRMSRARAAINRLGIRDAGAMLPQLQQFGLTAADLQQAQDNPWSDIKAIQLQADRARGQGQAEFAARGGFRSGGTAQAMEDIENQRARSEAGATQETLGGLSSDLFNSAEWERQQRDELDQRSADLEQQLAQTYQPYSAQAMWDPNRQAYRYQNTYYDQYGNVV